LNSKYALKVKLMNKVKNIIKKVCVIGEEAVGKTSLIRRFVVDKFDDKYIATIGTKNSKKNVSMRSDDTDFNLTMIIWDILGQKKFGELKRSAYKGANGAFIVLDLTRLETLYTFDEWLSSLYEISPDVPIVVLANKNDLTAKFGTPELKAQVKSHGFPFYFTSAKTGENVNVAFHTLGKMMLNNRRKLKPRTAKAQDTESYNDRVLTALDVEDIIMTRYCDLLGDPDFAMAIIRAQFKRADLNFKDPTIEKLEIAVDYLLNAASDHVEASRLAKEGKMYTDLIRMIGKEGSEKSLHS
jgi:small GTP-binding protein